MSKKSKGQYYTTNCTYILDGFKELLPSDMQHVVEPFAGQGDLIQWIYGISSNIRVEAYDIEPKNDNIIERDTLKNVPDYNDKWVITNPPYLARNKNTDKEIYDMYNTNDLYKCFIKSLVASECCGGILIIPAGFFFSPRQVDAVCRDAFMKKFKILRVRYFEETVFNDTPTTIVALVFQLADEPLYAQNVEWYMLPSDEKRVFNMSSQQNWIIGGDIYFLSANQNNIKIRRYVVGQTLKDKEQQTYMTLNALDNGTQTGRISLKYQEGYVYPAKDCSRSYATLCITGKTLSSEEQQTLCTRFNEFIEAKRKDTHSLFLPQYRESKEYARKRIPFELAYHIIAHLIA
jgi:hypothetical protein